MRKRLLRKAEPEFELDLAPLLAVMVKLVPVLLISSAFVQVGILETELPQLVTSAVQDYKNQKEKRLELFLLADGAAEVRRTYNGETEKIQIPGIEKGKFDIGQISEKLLEVKLRDTSLFTIELTAAPTISYAQVIRVMDSVRRSPHKQKFNVLTKDGTKSIQTELMFPDVIFANLFSKG